MASKPKATFSVRQVVRFDGRLRQILALDGDNVRFDLGSGWEYMPDVWDDLRDCRPLTAQEIGPGWMRRPKVSKRKEPK